MSNPSRNSAVTWHADKMSHFIVQRCQSLRNAGSPHFHQRKTSRTSMLAHFHCLVAEHPSRCAEAQPGLGIAAARQAQHTLSTAMDGARRRALALVVAQPCFGLTVSAPSSSGAVAVPWSVSTSTGLGQHAHASRAQVSPWAWGLAARLHNVPFRTFASSSAASLEAKMETADAVMQVGHGIGLDGCCCYLGVRKGWQEATLYSTLTIYYWPSSDSVVLGL